MRLCWLAVEVVCWCQRTHGNDATAQHVVDWSPVSQESCRRSLSVPTNAHVHLRVCLLPAQKQPVTYIRGIIVLLLLLQLITTTIVLWPCVRDNPGEPVREETFINSHLSLLSVILYQLPPSSMFNLHAWQSFCTTSVQVLFGLPLGLATSWPGTQEVDHRKLGERLWKKTDRHVDWTGRIRWILLDGKSR